MPSLMQNSGQTGYEDIQRKQKMADLLSAMAMGKQDLSHGSPLLAAAQPIMMALAAKMAQKKADAGQEKMKETQAKDWQGIIQAMQGTPAQPAQQFVDEQAQFMGQESPQGLTATEAVPAQPGSREKMVQAMLQAQDPQLRMAGLNSVMGTGSNQPSSVQEWNYYNSLPKEDQARFLEMKRNPIVMNTGGEFAVRQPGGGIGERYKVTPKPDQMPEFQGAQEAAKKAGEAKGKATVDLASAVHTAPKIIADVESLINHPGLDKSVGAWTLVPDKLMPGTERANFVARHNKVLGSTFLQAREMLKGGGTITDFESKRAEAAIAAMDRAQDAESYKAALRDFQQSVRDGVAKLEAQSGKKTTAPNSNNIITVDW